jgi:hypothetical protein
MTGIILVIGAKYVNGASYSFVYLPYIAGYAASTATGALRRVGRGVGLDRSLENGVQMSLSATAFDPETLAVLTRAFDAAWHEVQRTQPSGADRWLAARQKMALRILEAASEGERDLDRLKRSALLVVDASELHDCR